jgi:GNAT superfamily N-acetyltransferase
MGEQTPVTIRPATMHDATAIADVHVRSWQAAYRGMMPGDYLDRLDPADRLPLWRRLLADPDRSRADVLVAAGDDGICGFSSFGPTRDEDEDPGRVADVRAIYLAPGSMGHGVGRVLMTASVERLVRMGYEQVTLWVLDVNERARRFYEVARFRADGASKLDERDELHLTEVRYRRPLP